MTQLLFFFDDSETTEQAVDAACSSAASSISRPRKPRPKRAAAKEEATPKRGRVVRERGNFETLYLPFDEAPDEAPVVEAAAGAVPVQATPIERAGATLPTTRAARPAPPVIADLFADLDENIDDREARQKRIVFDPQVWQLQPERGDFINIRTGEVREEDDFLQIESDDAVDEVPEWAVD